MEIREVKANMPRFIEKPKEVIANQWFPPGHEKHDPSMLSKYTDEIGKVYKLYYDDVFRINLGEGCTKILPGYWVVQSYDYYENTNRYILLTDEQFKSMYNPKP